MKYSEGRSWEARSGAHVDKARGSVAALLEDERLPETARARLHEDYQQLQRLFDKLERGHVHVAVFGRVSVGKSALLNALVGEEVFATSVLHGKTKHSAQALWQEYDSGGVFLLDTPGIDEVDGQERTLIAENVAKQADIILFVVDGDLTDVEFEALGALHQVGQPMILVLNKADQLTDSARQQLLSHLQKRVSAQIDKDFVVATSASPEPYLQIIEREVGEVFEQWVRPQPDVRALKGVLWGLLKAGGQSYAALNASVFASALSEKVGLEIVAARKEIAERIIRQYALFKSVGVAVNPIPAVDLLALAADASMVVHLSRVYGIELTRNEAGQLIRTIAVQMGMLMGTVYGVHALSSVLKGLTAGLSTIITASAQAAVAFYGSYVIGKAAERYFAQGASWGSVGAKQAIQEILQDFDKEELMKEAKIAINQYLHRTSNEKTGRNT